MNDSSPEIIVGVTGGVAAFKTATLVSRLVQNNINVRVVMTRAAQKFVGTATFAALTGRPVVTDTFDETAFPLGPHIELAKQAKCLCIAPATADFIGKMAHGLADDLLSTLYLCFAGSVIVAPAMNNEMWKKAAVQRNIETIQKDGVVVVGPGTGWLSCRESGKGRMEEPDAIFQAILQCLDAH